MRSDLLSHGVDPSDEADERECELQRCVLKTAERAIAGEFADLPTATQGHCARCCTTYSSLFVKRGWAWVARTP